jgi:HTH-type transcriptional regulator, glycine betaine synthesis regulator
MKNDIQEITRRFVEAAGHMTQSLGAGRVIGQIYAHLFFSREPQTLDDLTAGLEISKGSASMAVRQLEQWGALKRVWVKGDRKAFYEATDEFGLIIRKALLDMVGRRVELADGLLHEAEGMLPEKKRNGGTADKDLEFVRQRVERLREFRDRAQGFFSSPIVRMLLKK